MNPFDFFDDIYCICISSREEKKRKAEEQFKQALEKCLDDLSKTDWDSFLLGGVVKEVKSHVTENLCLVDAYHTHAHALNRKFFDTVLSFEGDSKRYYDDGKRVWSRGSIDIFLSEKTLKYMIKPIMAIQPDKGSNTLQRYYDNVL